MKKDRAGTMTHDYKRKGVTTLFAAIDVLEDKVICGSMQCHTQMKSSPPPIAHQTLDSIHYDNFDHNVLTGCISGPLVSTCAPVGKYPFGRGWDQLPYCLCSSVLNAWTGARVGRHRL
jgi:hypothetical protein